LSNDGHKVHVFEQRQTVAEEASYACGALLSAGWPNPMAAPGMAWDLLYPGSSPTAIRMGQWPRPRDAAWLFRWWRNTGAKAHAIQRASALALTQLSLRELNRTKTDLGLTYENTEGLTVLIRSAHEVERLRPYTEWLKSAGLAHQVGNAALAMSAEPALNPNTSLHTAITLPKDSAGNCRQLTGALKIAAQERGVAFSFAHTVGAITPQPQGVCLDIHTPNKATSTRMNFDAVVLCSGASGPDLLRPLGIELPVRNLRSHSISANLRDPMNAPRSGVIDSLHNISITRLGQRVRIAGGQELAIGKGQHSTEVLKQLYQVLSDWFPGAAQMSSVQTWAGHTPVLPDGLPVLGATAVPGVWLNMGHGLRGWSMACGSARVVADQLAGRDCGIDAKAFDAQRWKKPN
jgi:D-amino-acid dehydrogenase